MRSVSLKVALPPARFPLGQARTKSGFYSDFVGFFIYQDFGQLRRVA